MSDKFIERARNNFYPIFSRSETTDKFSTKVKALASDEQEWDDGWCDFRVCIRINSAMERF